MITTAVIQRLFFIMNVYYIFGKLVVIPCDFLYFDVAPYRRLRAAVFNFNGVEFAFCRTDTAFEALFLIDFKRLLDFAGWRFCLTDTVAQSTTLAFFGNYGNFFYLSVSLGCADSAYGTDM